jgi:hypothetical protein
MGSDAHTATRNFSTLSSRSRSPLAEVWRRRLHEIFKSSEEADRHLHVEDRPPLQVEQAVLGEEPAEQRAADVRQAEHSAIPPHALDLRD